MFKNIFLKGFGLNFNNGIRGSLPRLEFDDEVNSKIKELMSNRSNLPTLSAIYRVKNVEHCLEVSVCSIAPICSEIIIVDNGSTDNTLFVAERIKNLLEGKVAVRVYEYHNQLAIAGENYRQELNSKNSLAKFYTFCFSKGSSSYLMKCDAHLIYLPSALSVIQKKLSAFPRVLMLRGQEIYGMKLSFEKYIFKNDNNFRYEDGEQYEELKFNFEMSLLEKIRNTIFNPSFIHFKRIKYVCMRTDNPVKELYSSK